MKIDTKFLEYKATVNSSYGNIDRISDTVFKFTQFNFLPENETDILDGHFTFFVNYKTFEYLVYKSADYGGFTYTIPCEFGVFLTKDSLPEVSKNRVEATIASKLLGAYFHDGNAIHSNGKNLFSDETPREFVQKNIYNEDIYRYSDGCKISLICDYRAFKWVDHVQVYSDIELKALKILCGYEQPNIQFDEITIKKTANKIRCKKGQTKLININIEGKAYTIVHNNYKFGGSTLCLMIGDTLISHESMCKNVTKFIRLIPVMLNNYAQ